MIEAYLSQRFLVDRVMELNEFEDLARSGRDITMMMGQTFDEGQPVDMLKYALVIMDLQDLLTHNGARVTSVWLIADHFMVEINQDLSAKQASVLAEARVEYLTKLNEVYEGDIRFVFSSELSQRSEYRENLARLKAERDSNPSFREMVLNAVPLDRRNAPNAFDYPFEELTVVQTLGADVKIGPKYEVFYDEPAREIAPVVDFKRFVAIHLTNSYPFGTPNLSPELQEYFTEFGILPYKKGSKGLGSYRLDPVNDHIDSAEALILATSDHRALSDLLLITQLAKQRLQHRPRFPAPSIADRKLTHAANLSELREEVLESYQRFVLDPLGAS